MSKTAIIDNTIDVIEAMDLLLGEGIPISGAIFDSSSSRFRSIAHQQSNSEPADNWTGTAADKYIQKNLFLQACEQIMADVDYITGTLITDEAQAVIKARDSLEHQIHHLDKQKPTARDLWDIPLIGPIISRTFQISVCDSAMTSVETALAQLTLTTMENTIALVDELAKIAVLLSELPIDIVKDWLADLEYLVAAILSELNRIIFAVEQVLQRVTLAVVDELKHAIADAIHGLKCVVDVLADELSRIPVLPSLTEMATMTGISGLGSLARIAHIAGTAPISDGASLSNSVTGIGSTAVSDVTHSVGAAGSPTMTPMASSIGKMSRLDAASPANDLGRSGNEAPREQFSAEESSAARQGDMPAGPLGQSAKNAGSDKGAAGGTGAVGRAPVNEGGDDEQNRPGLLVDDGEMRSETELVAAAMFNVEG